MLMASLQGSAGRSFRLAEARSFHSLFWPPQAAAHTNSHLNIQAPHDLSATSPMLMAVYELVKPVAAMHEAVYLYRAIDTQIGRASCRERVFSSV